MTDLKNYMPGLDQDVKAGGVVAFATSLTSSAPAVCFGSGAPTLVAPLGSIYLRTDGSSSSTRLYMNSDSSNTWVAITTAS